MSEDCGEQIRSLNSGKRIEEFMYHPTQRQWALAASWTNCEDFADEPCRIYKELYVTKNLGEEWTYLTNYVFDFEWAETTFTAENRKKYLTNFPEERIFVTREPVNSDHQTRAGTRGNWSVTVNLYMSDDFFKTAPRMLVEGGNTIAKTQKYMFVTVAASKFQGKLAETYSATHKSGFANVKPIVLPNGEFNYGHTFTVMDTS